MCRLAGSKVYIVRDATLRDTGWPERTMQTPETLHTEGYEAFYREFDSPLMRQLRREAYGEDIGQHSWVSAEELRADVQRLNLSSSNHFLDLGCGACGPLAFVQHTTGCTGVGLEINASALRAGRQRAAEPGVAGKLLLQEADLNLPLPFDPGTFDAAMSLDVVLHVRDRAAVFREVARVLKPGGRFLFTDAGVVTAPISSDEVHRRSTHGYMQFAPEGWNEALLESAGLRLLESDDRTSSVVKNASGRLAAMNRHAAELESHFGKVHCRSQQDYLESVIELAQRGALSRFMYLAESPGTLKNFPH